MDNVVIIGAGASGMTAAISAARHGARVRLVERQTRVGRKLLSTGNGRCNLTNTQCGLQNYHGENPEFVMGALSKFTPQDTIRFFGGLGLMTVEEYGGRVYPLSNQANSVLDVLRLALEREGVEVLTDSPVESAACTKKGFELRCRENVLRCEKLIVACGGCAGAEGGQKRSRDCLLKHHKKTFFQCFPSSLVGI